MEDIFSYLYPKYKIRKPVRLITLFSGYDSQKLAFDYLGINVEHYKAIEFDKYAVQTLNEIHNTNFSTTDINNIGAKDLEIVDTDKFEYIMTYSFPCTSLSLAVAGKIERGIENNLNKSGLLFQVQRILEECTELPQILIMENVPQVLTDPYWITWYKFLEDKNYKNYVSVLDSQAYGIPQHRERCFMVSILGEYSYEFPKKIELKKYLVDFLEKGEVDEKFYLSQRMKEYIVALNDKWNGSQTTHIVNRKVATTINTNEENRRCGASNFIVEDIENEFDLKKYINDKGNLEKKIYNISNEEIKKAIDNNEKIEAKKVFCDYLVENGIVEEYDVVRHSYTSSRLDNFKVEGKNISSTLSTRSDTLGVAVKNELSELRIRKLTPRECFRLMGVKNKDIDKITCSNAQQYKQSGNSIVTTCLMGIYSTLFDNVDFEQKVNELIEEIEEKNEISKEFI